MNNVKNDERFYVSDDSKKSFSWKLDEKEFIEYLTNSSNKHQNLNEIKEGKTVEEYLNYIIKIKTSLELNIKRYINTCTWKEKNYDFKKVKEKLDEFEIQLLDLERIIEMRKALLLLQDDYDIKQKPREKAPQHKIESLKDALSE